MRRQLTKQSLGRVYRQFSRQKYNKYRHQFPRMRESQLITRIIKEWENMDNANKQKLSQHYREHNFIKEDEDSSNFSQARKNAKALQQSTVAIAKINKPSLGVKQYPKISRFDQQDSGYNRSSQKMSEDQRSQRSSSLSLVVVKDSTDNKNNGNCSKKGQYVQFYKFHYAKLAKEHPRWRCIQISKIVRLLWQKRQKNLKMNARLKKGLKIKTIRKLTGRMFFCKRKQIEGVSIQQSKMLWKRLPSESKQMLKFQGKGEIDNEFNNAVKTHMIALKSENNNVSSCNPFGYILQK